MTVFEAPVITKDTVEHRLETGAHGMRGSLPKCAARYRTFLETSQAQQPDADAIEQSKDELSVELQLYRVEFQKQCRKLQTVRDETANVELALNEQQALVKLRKRQVDTLTRDLCREKQVWGFKEEFEALAKMGNHRPSRAILEKRLLLTKKQRQLANESLQQYQDEITMRQVQFETMMQCMIDLQQSIVDNDTNNDNGDENDKEAVQEDDDDEEEEGLVPMDTSI